MRTFIEHINEGKKLDPLRGDLFDFLRREKIIGYDESILSILNEEPDDNVIEDLVDSFEDESIKISEKDVMSMDIKSMLERYLEWNGIKGYTESIINLTGKSKSELHKGRELLTWKNKYYYRPERGESTIWAWETPDTEGIPELIKVKTIYKTPTYYSKEYHNKIEKVYSKD